VIRVLLADDHGVVRDGLGRLIAGLDDIELVGEAANGAEAVEQARLKEPDVVLMDLDMPVLDGIEATRQVLAERPDTAVIVLTAFSDRPRINRARAATSSRTSTRKEWPKGFVRRRAASRHSTREPHARSSMPVPNPIRSPRSRIASVRCLPCWSKDCRTS
jgi:CheY-like chemotaxis protein